MEYVHQSVMADEVLEYLKPDDEKACLWIDGTLGEGGHSERILETYAQVKLCAIDADEVIMAKARERLSRFGDRVSFYHQWFDDFFSSWPLQLPADRILLDLGISIFHYSESGRGFSFAKDEPLDMRLSTSAGRSVAEYLSECKEYDLMMVLFNLGEERYARRIAARLMRLRGDEGAARMHALTARELAELISSAVPAEYRRGRIHPATRTFQALRMLVNDELGRLERSLIAAWSNLAGGGRLAVISFHSLEDRLVKHTFVNLARACVCPPELPRCQCGGVPKADILTKKPVVASDAELERNPPSRSAKLRVIRKR